MSDRNAKVIVTIPAFFPAEPGKRRKAEDYEFSLTILSEDEALRIVDRLTSGDFKVKAVKTETKVIDRRLYR